jgi:hypothetical protein
MAGSQFRNVSDVCTAMKQFATGTSQETAKGSFAPLNSLTALSDAIVCLCDEITQLRAELDDLRTKSKAGMAAPPPAKGAAPLPKSLLKKKSKKAVRSAR